MAVIGERLPEPEVGWKRYDDRSSLINYVGTWNKATNTSYYNGTDTDSNVVGDYYEFCFLGTELRIIDALANNRSADVTVSIDGVEESYSAYGTTTMRAVLVYEKTGLSNTIHKVRVTNNATDYLVLDAIDINEDGEVYRYDYLENRDLPEVMRKYGLHWFDFNEDSGNVTDKIGSAIGTVYANAVRVEGWNSLGNAMKFNRTSTSYVNFDDRVIPTDSYTLRFKLKLFTKPTSENQELFSNAFSTQNHTGLRIWVNTEGVLTFTGTRKVNGTYKFGIGLDADFDGKWHDFIFTWDARTRVVAVYRDGVLAGKDISVTTNWELSTYNLRIARQASNSEQRYANCEMDDIQVYSKALKLEEFEEKRVAVRTVDDKLFVLNPKNSRIKELPSVDDADIVKQGYLWNDIDSASTSDNIDMTTLMTEYEVVGKDNTILGSGKIFTLPISNFKTVKIEDNY